MREDELHGWYAAFKSKDTRFDGRFFVGVSSTGIYCRPVCRAKLPKAENCTYYPTAAAAEQAGYRPCLVCRPELAPGTSVTDASASLARRASRLLEENCGSGQSLEELAGCLGCTDRHLRRVFAAEYHVSPIQYLQTCRLLLAKSLLTDTNLTVLDVAMTSGFGSLRRFNTLFKKRYRLSPTSLRRQTAGGRKSRDDMTLFLGYRPPYLWQQMLNFLAQRAILGVETIQGGKYLRTVHLVTEEQKHVYGWISVSKPSHKDILTVTVAASLLPVLPQVLARVRNLFDMYCEPDAVYEVLTDMNRIRPGLCVPGIRVPGCFDPYELTVRAVLGQQITVKAASTLASRFAATYGTPVQTGIEGLTHAFPLPDDIIALDGEIGDHLGTLGIISARAKTILALARTFVQGDIDFELCVQPEAEIQKLTTIPGIGSWTAQYIAMRTMRWPDVFLETDAGVKKALASRSPKEMLAMAEAWRPWRSYATMNLWNSLQNTN
ncbi:MAG: helix-turn-helix domain-containing protein [Planctomycetaceae bacterium]|jgi:AraC family transcriptional regulator of adaptative response / DNA-3-methyladenine glycosylase II|nr:helix-turn-helix domain-containing protein [Planctomycetaceae bacterium]